MICRRRGGPRAKAAIKEGEGVTSQESGVDQMRQDASDGRCSLGIGGDRARKQEEGRARDRSMCELARGLRGAKERG